MAPSEGEAEGVTVGRLGMGKLGMGGIGGVGAGKIGGAGGTYEIGGGGTNDCLGGSGLEESGLGGSGKNGAESTAGRGRPEGGIIGLEGALEIREGVSALGLNHPVNPVPADSFPAIPLVGRGSSGCWGLTAPNMAVKSPTVFRVSSGGGEIWGVSEGRSPRKGPWKKLVNSPSLALSLTGGGLASAGKFLSRKLSGKESGGELRGGSALGATGIRGASAFQVGGAAIRTPERSADVPKLGGGWGDGAIGLGGAMGASSLAGGSNSRSN